MCEEHVEQVFDSFIFVNFKFLSALVVPNSIDTKQNLVT